MTNKEMVISVLNDTGCMNSFQIKGAVYRKFGKVISPQSAAGSLRPLIYQGMVGSSKDANNKTVYWLTDYGKEKLCK